MRFRNQLLVLVLSVLIPAFLAAILAVWYVFDEEQHAQEKGLLEATRTFSLLVGKELQAKETALQTLSNSAALAKGDLLEFYSIARRLAPTPETTIVLIDRADQQVLNTRRPFGAPLPKQRASNLNELMQTYGANRTIVSDAFLAPLGNRHDFAVQVPVVQGDAIPYFLMMGINATALQPLVEQQRLPEHWLAVILDRKGVVMARSRNAEQYVGKPASDYFRKHVAAAHEGVFRSVTLDGVPVKTFFSRVAFSDWSVILSIPESELRSAPLRAAAFLALIMAMLLGIAFLVAQRVAARVNARMKQLELAADKLGRGEEVRYQPQGLMEIDAVAAKVVDASLEIRRSKQEMEQRVAQAVAETERVQQALLHSQKLEALGRLTGGISHEFNNLLQALTTSLHLARMVSTERRVQDLIDTCNKAVTRAASLTSQLGAFGRVQDARVETVVPDKHVSVFTQLVENILPSNITLQVQMPDHAWPVTIDATQLELALINLAINARDAMPGGGQIRVEVSNETLAQPPEDLAPGDYLRVCMTDTGKGMSTDVLAKARDPFFTTKKIGEGTGLGLAQAYGFARQSGGTLVLHSVEGKGTTIEILLPRAHLPLSPPRMQTEPGSLKQGARGTVLFVEDDALIRDSVAAALKQAGYEVITADSGDRALALLEGGTSADVLFSDIVMPGHLSGIDLAATVRQHHPQMKIVLATGYSEQRVQIPGVKLLPKPYSVAEVAKVLSEERSD